MKPGEHIRLEILCGACRRVLGRVVQRGWIHDRNHDYREPATVRRDANILDQGNHMDGRTERDRGEHHDSGRAPDTDLANNWHVELGAVMAWDETKVHMTVDGADLVLDEGHEWGYFETDKNDTGALRNYGVKVLIEVEENPASTGTSRYTLEWKYSEDDATWTDYKEFREGEYYFRYCYFKATVYGDLATSQRPKITHLEAAIGPVDSLPVVNSVITQQGSPSQPSCACPGTPSESLR